MTPIRVVNRTRGTVLGTEVRLADTFFGRMRGFLFRGAPTTGEGMLLSPCQAVHMFGMRFALDVVFIDQHGTVVGLYAGLRPWRWTPVHRQAVHALELPPGTIRGSGTEAGDALSWAAAVEPEPPTPSFGRRRASKAPTRRPA